MTSTLERPDFLRLTLLPANSLGGVRLVEPHWPSRTTPIDAWLPGRARWPRRRPPPRGAAMRGVARVRRRLRWSVIDEVDRIPAVEFHHRPAAILMGGALVAPWHATIVAPSTSPPMTLGGANQRHAVDVLHPSAPRIGAPPSRREAHQKVMP